MKRTKVIIPDSAHGTNPASAAVCGLEIVEVKSTPEGLVDVEDLKPLLGDDIAGMMMTNPNTLGLFEKEIPEIAKLIHENGGLMYYDGANLNPLLGVARPGDMGFDVMHINLHKTFSTLTEVAVLVMALLVFAKTWCHSCQSHMSSRQKKASMWYCQSMATTSLLKTSMSDHIWVTS